MSNEIVTLDKDQLAQIEKLSLDMSKTQLAIPRHLQGNAPACKAIVRNSIRWKMDPYLVAQESSDIKGKLMYSGKLVNAVVSEDPRLEFPLDFEFEGKGENMVCTVIGKLKGEKKERRVNVPMPPSNKRVSDHWRSNQEQQLSYYSARVWTRRHLPGKLLGVWTPDDPHADTYHPQKETNNIMDNIERSANQEEPVAEENDPNTIDGECSHVEPEQSEVNIRLLKADGNEVDFDSFEGWLDFMETNLPKQDDVKRLEAFEENHKAIFAEYDEAGYKEWSDKARKVISDNKKRLGVDNGSL